MRLVGGSRSFKLADEPLDLADAAFKVVVHWKDFASVGSRAEALDLLRQQAPAAGDNDRVHLFDAVSLVHDHAVDAVPRHVRRRRFKLLPFATRGDIDHGACMTELEEIAPNVSRELKADMLGWVIHWYWER